MRYSSVKYKCSKWNSKVSAELYIVPYFKSLSLALLLDYSEIKIVNLTIQIETFFF